MFTTTNSRFLKSGFISKHWHYNEIKSKKEQHEEVLRAFLSHDETSTSDLEEFIEKNTLLIGHELSILTNKQCPPLFIKNKFHNLPLGKDSMNEMILLIAKNPNTPDDIILKLTALDREDVWSLLVTEKSLPVVVLRYILMKTKNVNTRRKIVNFCAKAALFFPELISKPPIEEHISIVAKCPIPENIFGRLWGGSKQYQCALLSNPYTDEKATLGLFTLCKEDDWEFLAANPNTPASLLEKMANSTRVSVRQAVAKNPNTTVKVLSKLCHDRNVTVKKAVASNPATLPQDLLTLARNSDDNHADVRVQISLRCNLPESVIAVLLKDKNKKVRANIALQHLTSISDLKTLANDIEPSVSSKVLKNPNMGAISTLIEYQIFLSKNPELAFLFYNLESPKKTLKLLIGSKHQEEINFVFGAKHIDCIDTISSIQSMFLTPKFKTDRDSYIGFLGELNSRINSNQFNALNIDGRRLAAVRKHFGTELMFDIISQYEITEARDTLELLGSVVSFENKSQNKRHQNIVLNYLKEGKEGSIAEGHIFCLHRFLTKMSLKLFGGISRNFKQESMLANFNDAMDVISKDSEYKNWRLNWPVTTEQLAYIGKRQNHCVGTQYYADRCVEGSNIIFQISPKGNLRRGFTFQFHTSGRLLQSQGFSNDVHVPRSIESLARKVLSAMKQPIECGLEFDSRMVTNMDPVDRDYDYLDELAS